MKNWKGICLGALEYLIFFIVHFEYNHQDFWHRFLVAHDQCALLDNTRPSKAESKDNLLHNMLDKNFDG